jgi:predicted phage terminase large subunit-like protein
MEQGFERSGKQWTKENGTLLRGAMLARRVIKPQPKQELALSGKIMTGARKAIRPQPKQELALSSNADILIFGGGAGGGKSWTLLLESMRHTYNPEFGAVIFRRTSPQITNPGGLWDESNKLFPLVRAKPNQTDHKWTFPSGAIIQFAHLQYEKNLSDWQGSQIAMIGFDELTHFLERQFWYMLSRNRSMSGVKPYIRATCNPDADSWVAKLIAWWIDEETGFPIEERAGVIRWFVRINGELIWSDTKEELADQFPELVEELGEDFAKSITFVPSLVDDNQELLKVDKAYKGNLYALPLVDRMRLLNGNWKVRLEAGKFFNRSWFEIVSREDLPPIDVICSFWDLAATEKEIKGSKTSGGNKDPDYSARVMIGYSRKTKQFVILDAFQIQAPPAEVDRLLKQMAQTDLQFAKTFRARFMLRVELEGGSAAKREAFKLEKEIRQLGIRDVDFIKPRGDKFERAKPQAKAAENGEILVLLGSWNGLYLSHIHNQPDEPHDDLMDAGSGAFNELETDADEARGF